jgi:hypothetical protein
MELLPPPTAVFETALECAQYANEFAAGQGYTMTTRTSKYLDISEVHTLITAYLHCNKSGVYRNRGSEGNQKKEVISRLVDCPFRAEIRCRPIEGNYQFYVTASTHNHDPTIPLALPRELSEETQEMVCITINRIY